MRRSWESPPIRDVPVAVRMTVADPALRVRPGVPRGDPRQKDQAEGSGSVLSAHQPVDRRVPHLQWGEHSPEPAWSTDLGITPPAEIPQSDGCHDDVENG